MKLSAIFSALILFISCTSCAISEPVSDSSKVSILNAPGFNHFENTLRSIIKDRASDLKGVHHFYVARYDKGSTTTHMLWKEGRKLWILTLGDEKEEHWLAARYPSGGQLIDLDSGVVKTEEEVGTSTYLVTQSWANEKVFQAVVNGDLIKINHQ